MTAVSEPVKQRLEILDLARGVGFLLVLLRHSLGFVSSALLVRVMPQDATILDFFFLLSGFFAGYSNDEKLRSGRTTIWRQILARIARFFPMIFLSTLLGVMPLFAQMTLNDAGFRHIILVATAFTKSCLLIPTHAPALGDMNQQTLFPLDVPLWFLFYDCLAYLIFLTVLRRLPFQILVAIAGLAAVGLWNAALTRNNVSFGAAWIDVQFAVPRMIFGFTTGYLLFRFYRMKHRKIQGWPVLTPIALLLSAIFIPVPATWAHSGELQATIAIFAMPLILFLGMYTKAGPHTAYFSKWAARLSLGVYALHFPIVRMLSELRWELRLHGILGLMLLAFEILVTLAAAYYATVFFDEPIREFLFKKMRARPPKTPNLLHSANR